MEISPPLSVHDVTFDIVADVIVVGMGAAGACAAIEAKEAGADVLVIERTSGGGGSSAMSISAAAPGCRRPTASMTRPRRCSNTSWR
jgi:succinate dehydrogenase/fumarate reductase flavoprotein subunit